MTNIPEGARFQVEKSGRKWLIIDTEVGESLPGPYKTRHLAEADASQMNAADQAAQDEAVGPTPTPDPERVAGLVAHLEQAVARREHKAPAERDADPAVASGQELRGAAAAEHGGEPDDYRQTPEAPVDPESMDRTQRILAAKAEVEAVRAWKASAADGSINLAEMPATPVLDWMADPTNGNKVHAAPKSARKTHDYTPEQLAAITAHIVNGRKAGRSWAKIAKEIEGSGIPTARGGKWYDTTASDLAKKLGLDATPAEVA